jgi:hypothetical protein
MVAIFVSYDHSFFNEVTPFVKKFNYFMLASYKSPLPGEI